MQDKQFDTPPIIVRAQDDEISCASCAQFGARVPTTGSAPISGKCAVRGFHTLNKEWCEQHQPRQDTAGERI